METSEIIYGLEVINHKVAGYTVVAAGTPANILFVGL